MEGSQTEYMVHVEVRVQHVGGPVPEWEEVAGGIVGSLRGGRLVVTRRGRRVKTRLVLIAATIDEAEDPDV